MEKGRDGSGEESLKAGHLLEATTQGTTDQREGQSRKLQSPGEQKGLMCLGDVAQQHSGESLGQGAQWSTETEVFYTSRVYLTYD